MEPEAAGRIVDHLFPQLPALVVTRREFEEEGPPLLTAAEIDATVDRVCDKARKVPGPQYESSRLLLVPGAAQGTTE